MFYLPQIFIYITAPLNGRLIGGTNVGLLINCNIATYLTGSALIPLGLTWWQAIIAIILGNILATAALILASLAGAYYHSMYRFCACGQLR